MHSFLLIPGSLVHLVTMDVTLELKKARGGAGAETQCALCFLHQLAWESGDRVSDQLSGGIGK